eukprot:UN14801
MEEIINDIRKVGDSHGPADFMTANLYTDETQFRYLSHHQYESTKIWNSYFDKHNIDMIITPTQHSTTLRLDEMVESKGPLEVLQEDGSYKIEYVSNAARANLGIMFALKHFPISKT